MRTERPGRPGVRPEQRGRRPEQPRPIGDLIYGRNGVLEALAGRRRHQRLLIADGIKEDQRIRRARERAIALGLAVDRVPRIELDDRTGGANHQGIGLLTSGYPYVPLGEIADAAGTILVLDHLQDPQNLGTLLRAAEAAAVAGVVIPRDRAADVSPAVVNASAGAVEHLRIAREPNLIRAVEQLKQTGRLAIGLDASDGSVDLFTGDLPLPAVLIVGSEGEGITHLMRRACDLLVAIPMAGRVRSLNAATAGAIALFELVRRGREAPFAAR